MRLKQQVFLEILSIIEEMKCGGVVRAGVLVLPDRGGMHKFIGGKISDKLCQMLTPAAAHFFHKELLAGRDSDLL